MVSNAADKSKRVKTEMLPSSKARSMSFITFSSAVSVPYPGRSADLEEQNSFFFFLEERYAES